MYLSRTRLRSAPWIRISLLTFLPQPFLALQRYLCRYNLLDAHGSLSYHHAVHPFPRLPSELTPPLAGRLLAKPAPEETRGKKRGWREPKTPEFADLSAHDVPDIVVQRLAGRARAHWDKKDSVKEGCVMSGGSSDEYR